MLDPTGITLDEISKMYPQRFQVMNYDVAFDTDSMGRPKVLSSFELGVNTILTLLFMKPGQYPSIPELGIDIESYLHEYADDEGLLSWMLSCRDKVTVLEPERIREKLYQITAEVARKYEGDRK